MTKHKVKPFIYQKIFIPFKVFFLRRKKIITVAFVLSDLSKWKTEPLYKKMISHPRFHPVIFVIPFRKYTNSKSMKSSLKSYLKDKGYDYYCPRKRFKFTDYIKPDIIFYQEPYKDLIDINKRYYHYPHSLFCYVPYTYNLLALHNFYDQPLFDYVWQFYLGNEFLKPFISKYLTHKDINLVVTGFPFSDELLSAFSGSPDFEPKKKKTIIWAPHHSMTDSSWLHFSTFLRYCDYMLLLADRYKEDISIVFKPHPLLMTKLYQVWGQERTDDYYSRWAYGKNTQLVTGDYISLFINSDAMIHDCGSFTIEYLYTKKPVMYLINDEHHSDQLNEFDKMAFNLHYKGRCEDDIESFINNVIEGIDEMKNERLDFYKDYLLPPDGTSASDNIINAILG